MMRRGYVVTILDLLLLIHCVECRDAGVFKNMHSAWMTYVFDVLYSKEALSLQNNTDTFKSLSKNKSYFMFYHINCFERIKMYQYKGREKRFAFIRKKRNQYIWQKRLSMKVLQAEVKLLQQVYHEIFLFSSLFQILVNKIEHLLIYTQIKDNATFLLNATES